MPSLANLFVYGSNSLRPRARRAQLKRDPLGGSRRAARTDLPSHTKTHHRAHG